MDVSKELREIGQLLGDANLITAIRREVTKIKRDGIVVTDGSHYENGSEWDAIVRAGNDVNQVARRIRSKVKNVEVKKIADNILGIRTAGRSV